MPTKRKGPHRNRVRKPQNVSQDWWEWALEERDEVLVDVAEANMQVLVDLLHSPSKIPAISRLREHLLEALEAWWASRGRQDGQNGFPGCPKTLSTPILAGLLGVKNHSTVVLMRQRMERKARKSHSEPTPEEIENAKAELRGDSQEGEGDPTDDRF